MYRKIVYIVICSLFLTHVSAQQEKALKLLNKIRTDVEPILKDSTFSQNCLKNIEGLRLELPARNTVSINDRKIQLLLNTSKKFITFHDKARDSTCRDKKIDGLIVIVKQLFKELGVIKNIPPLRKDSLAKIAIVIIDSATRKGVNGNLAIDSTGSAITRFTARRDSTGYFDVLLALNRPYTIRVKKEQYLTFTREYIVNKDGDIVSIRLQNTDTTVISAGPGASISAEVPPAVPLAIAQEQPAAWYVYLAVIVFIFLLFAAILYFNVLAKSIRKPRGKKFRAIINPALVFQKEIKEKDAFIYEINHNLEVVESSLSRLTRQQQATNVHPKKAAPVEIKDTTGRYFLCEIMMTAGPRKKFMNDPSADKDLGEDVCGFISTSNEVLLWVLDGTSDVHCLINPENKREYFSSRLQAQCIAEKLKKHFGEKPAATLDGIMKAAVQSVKLDWLKVINQLPEVEKKRLKTNISNQNFPECSTTLLLSKLLINGDFTGYRSGDSKMLLFNTNPDNKLNLVETTLAAKNPQSNDRMFFRLQFDTNGEFDIMYNEPMFEIVEEKNISLVVGISDGIGLATEQALKGAYKNAPDEIRQEIILQRQGTADDKAICFLEIKQQE